LKLRIRKTIIILIIIDDNDNEYEGEENWMVIWNKEIKRKERK
jgi:hypothetical protein